MTYQVGDIVKSIGKDPNRESGVVKHRTCRAATALGGKTCDRNNCTHSPKNHIWVKWPNDKLCSYRDGELEHDHVGEEEILDTMANIIDNGSISEAENADLVVNTIIRSRSRRNYSENSVVEVKTNNSLFAMFKQDAERAAYRVAATQINTGIRSAVVESLKKKGASNEQIASFSSFLETEWGSALLGMVAGVGLTYIPGIKDNGKAQRLATEFRQSGMATVGNEVIAAAIAQFMPAINSALSALPEESVSSREGTKSEEEVEVEVDISEFNSLESHMEEEEKRMVQGG